MNKIRLWGRSVIAKEYICFQCRKNFIAPHWSNRKYCSRQCYGKNLLGKKPTIETRIKLSNANKRGKSVNCYICNKLIYRKNSIIKKCKKFFCSKECWMIDQKNKIYSETSRLKMSMATRGKKHWRWKGGVGKLNDRLRRRKDYIRFRFEIFKRDGFVCQECGAKGVYLNMHHIKPFALYKKLRFELSNCITLCKNCHDKKPKGNEIYKV